MSDEQGWPTEDPRQQGTGQGLPESNPAETTPRDGTESGPAAVNAEPDAPDTSSDEDSDPDQATGNPNAAG